PRASVRECQDRVEAVGDHAERDRSAHPDRSHRPRSLLPGVRSMGRGRTQARRDAAASEDPGRLCPGLALAHDLEQAGRADDPADGGTRPHALGAISARHPDPERAEALGVRRPLGEGGMTMRGRKPNPTALRRLNGNPGKRGYNHLEPVAPEGLPDCPPHLSELARAEWDRIAQVLYEMGVLTMVDRAALAAYCQAYARWAEAE